MFMEWLHFLLSKQVWISSSWGCLAVKSLVVKWIWDGTWFLLLEVHMYIGFVKALRRLSRKEFV